MLGREEITDPNPSTRRATRGKSIHDVPVTSKRDSKHDERHPSPGVAGVRAPIVGALSIACALPPVLICIATLVGVGLDQGLSPVMSFMAALFLSMLPALGVASLLRLGGIGIGIALIGWSICVLAAFPSYFPARRGPSLEMGIRFFATPLGSASRETLVAGGKSLLSLLGPEAPGRLRALPIDEFRGDWILHAEDPLPIDASAAEQSKDTAHSVTVIPYEGEGASIRIPIYVDGPEFGEQYMMIFDTGATLTTLDRARLDDLEIEPSPDAPSVTLHTAAGEMEATLALVDAIWIGDRVVEWVTVAICDTCIEGDAVGLLGLNVSSHFRVSIDHEAKAIELYPRPGQRNRRIDIRPWITLGATLKNWSDGRAEIDLEIENRAPTEIESIRLEITCPGDRFIVQLDPIPANETIHQTVTLPWNSECNQIQIIPLFAQWQLDRF